MNDALARARAELADVVELSVVHATITAIEQEQARLIDAGRGITLVLESLLGHQHVPRL